MRLAVDTQPKLCGPDSAPIQATEFENWLARLGPFEHAPRIAVAVSGGRDSVALAILAKDWVLARGGEIFAITIDHGLRVEASGEAELVGRWMSERDIAHHIVRWTSPERESGIEAAARNARYALLDDFCRDHSILHLLIGHHRADQLETHQMRQTQGSGSLGLAGMAAIREMTHMRLLRPLLDVSRERITATLEAIGQNWIEDPSNQDERFARARMRAQGGAQAASNDVWRSASLRNADERKVSALAAAGVRIDPAGFAMIDVATIRNAPADLSRILFGNVLTSISGGVYPPRGSRLDRLWARLMNDELDRTWTLGGCLVRPAGAGKVCVLREPSAVTAPVKLLDPKSLWDGRFVIDANGFDLSQLNVDALGRSQEDHSQQPDFQPLLGLAKDVWATLPALFSGGQLVAYPSFERAGNGPGHFHLRFAPRKPVSGAAFGNL